MGSLRPQLHQWLAEQLVRRMDDGVWGEGDRLPPERQLAEEFDVSRVTLRKALEELERTGRVERKVGCRPVVLPREAVVRLKSPTEEIHVFVLFLNIVADFAGMFILRGIQRNVHDRRIKLVVPSVRNWDSASPTEVGIRHLKSMASDPYTAGAIIWYMWYMDDKEARAALESARASGTRLVFVDREPPDGISGDYIGTDNLRAARRAVSHLIRQGHRRIACVKSFEAVSSVVARAAGYRDALHRAGIAIRDELETTLDYIGCHDADVATRDMASRLLALNDPPTAVFTINDSIATHLMNAFRSLGKRVPEDISIIGMDGAFQFAPGGAGLTTLQQQFERIGEVAIELLEERIFTGGPKASRHVLFDAPLLDMGSVAPAPISESDRDLRAEKNTKGAAAAKN